MNRASLAEYAEPEKFRSALNTVDAEHILENAAADLHELTFDEETGSIPDWAEQLLAPNDDITTFVNVGRLSPEKNQERLIRAFAQVHAESPKTRLLIVGSGPLAGHLESVVAELGLQGSVFLTGMQRNPHAIMAKADCFVLSSDYEGQPMVILEALVLQLPIVTVEFASAKNALPKGSGLVVPQSVDSTGPVTTARRSRSSTAPSAPRPTPLPSPLWPPFPRPPTNRRLRRESAEIRRVRRRSTYSAGPEPGRERVRRRP